MTSQLRARQGMPVFSTTTFALLKVAQASGVCMCCTQTLEIACTSVFNFASNCTSSRPSFNHVIAVSSAGA